MIFQSSILGPNNIERSCEILRANEPFDGYRLQYSGGKDSTVLLKIAEMAGVKFTSHYQNTTIDPPELVYHGKKYAKFEPFNTTMFRLIVKKKYPPTRFARWCCEELKEFSGDNRSVLLGVRAGESSGRKQRGMIQGCPNSGKITISPLFHWTTEDIWDFIKGYNLPYCSLYDEGWKRLGCVGCPMSSNQEKEFKRWPKIAEGYVRAFKKMLEAREREGKKTTWKTPEEVMKWFVRGK